MDKEEILSGLGARIRAVLGAREMSQSDLAKAVKVSNKTINLIVRGQTKSPGFELIIDIAKALDISVGYLAGEDDNIPYYQKKELND